MNVSAIIVTRGDVHLFPVLASMPAEWEIVVWDNSGGGMVDRWFPGRASEGSLNRNRERVAKGVGDLSVYGRYAGIQHATADLIYVQDDDVIVSDPQAIVDELVLLRSPGAEPSWDGIVCNMPQEFRAHYTDSALVGFGAAFHRDLPERAFDRFGGSERLTKSDFEYEDKEFFNRTCDVVFTTLTPRVLVDVPKTNLPWAEDENRMYRTPGHVEERQRMLELARKVHDGR